MISFLTFVNKQSFFTQKIPLLTTWKITLTMLNSQIIAARTQVTLAKGRGEEVPYWIRAAADNSLGSQNNVPDAELLSTPEAITLVELIKT